MKKPRTHVTDHAVLRYLERVRGLDIEALRREIGARVDRACAAGASGVQIDGFTYQIAHDGGVPTVVTLTHTNRPDIRTGCCKTRRGAA